MDDDKLGFSLGEDSICYGCQYYSGDGGCDTPQPCVEGRMNGYRMDG